MSIPATISTLKPPSFHAKLWTLGTYHPYVHILRLLLHMVVVCCLMAVLCLPLLERLTPMRGKAMHYEYLLFSFRYWREGSLSDSTLEEIRHSIYCVAVGTFVIAAGPVVAMLRFDRTLMVALGVAIVCFLFSVLNMAIGLSYFNKSAGAHAIGAMVWGPSQNYHLLTALLMAVPFVFLLLEWRAKRREAKLTAASSASSSATDSSSSVDVSVDVVDPKVSGMPAPSSSGQPEEGAPDAPPSNSPIARVRRGITNLSKRTLAMTPFARRIVIVTPLLLALVTAFAGIGTVQGYNHKSDNYMTAWHYDIVAFEHDLAYMKKNFCPELYKKTVLRAGAITGACIFAYLSVITAVFVSGHAIISGLFTGLSLVFTVLTFATGNFRPAIQCDAANSAVHRGQGELDFSQGFTFLYIAVIFAFVDFVVLVLTRDINEEVVDGTVFGNKYRIIGMSRAANEEQYQSHCDQYAMSSGGGGGGPSPTDSSVGAPPKFPSSSADAASVDGAARASAPRVVIVDGVSIEMTETECAANGVASGL